MDTSTRGHDEAGAGCRPRVIDVLRRYVARYVERSSPPLRVRGVLVRLHLCRTAALGGERFVCASCGAEHALYHSCGERHCPQCRGAARADWEERMAQNLLPVPYFQGVFTIPKELSSLTLGNRKAFFNLLFRSAAASLNERLAEERGIRGGPQLALHTWDQRLEAHVHVHVLHPAGGLSLDGSRWVVCPRIRSGKHRGKLCLVDNRMLSEVFREKFLKGLDRLRRRGELKLEGSWSELREDGAWEQFMKPLREQDWAVYLQPPPTEEASAEELVKYLARYVSGGPIGDSRMISDEEGTVTFWARDKSKTGRRVPVRMSGVEFVRRWSLHILPKGFHRVRYYGGLHPSKRAAYLARCRTLLAASSSCCEESGTSDSESADEWVSEEALARWQLQQGICPSCRGPLRRMWSKPKPRSWRVVLASRLAPAWYRPGGL